MLFVKRNDIQGIILFETTVRGEYTFIISKAKKSKGDLDVTLALHTYDEKEDAVSFDLDETTGVITKKDSQAQIGEGEISESEDGKDKAEDYILSVRQTLSHAYTMAKKVSTESKMSMQRQESHNQDLLDNMNWNIVAMLIECVVFVSILAY